VVPTYGVQMYTRRVDKDLQVVFLLDLLARETYMHFGTTNRYGDLGRHTCTSELPIDMEIDKEHE
jgi:hypothetical protein